MFYSVIQRSIATKDLVDIHAWLRYVTEILGFALGDNWILTIKYKEYEFRNSL